MQKFGSTPLTGDEHSSDPVNYTVPSALSENSHAVIFKIPEPIRSAREHPYLRVESFGDAVRFGETPHAHNRFEHYGLIAFESLYVTIL
uniref:Uncharacterized protein n=1 Tax=Candidatus Nitrotoga fabula TaxID=2182327 RepID=A0A2X0QVP9_9PROT|nr:protein of unknown function [Candidatus Nitrotoga fabula]